MNWDDATVANFNQWREMLITNRDFSGLLVSGMEDPSSLDANERHRSNHVLGTFAWAVWQLVAGIGKGDQCYVAVAQ